MLIGAENTVSSSGVRRGSLLLRTIGFFFQVVFVATAMSIISGAVAERIKLWPFCCLLTLVMTGLSPVQGLELGRGLFVMLGSLFPGQGCTCVSSSSIGWRDFARATFGQVWRRRFNNAD